ncbi:stealth conserved region 3 domain-containing protein [Kitasatospora sp. NPDC004240]
MSIRRAHPSAAIRPLAALARRWASPGTDRATGGPQAPDPSGTPGGTEDRAERRERLERLEREERLARLERLTEARRAREDELLGAATGTVRQGDHLAEPHRDLLPGTRRDANLAEVSEALRTAGLTHGLVPDRRPRHRLAITPGDRPAVLAALAAAFAGRPVYADLLEHGRTLGTVLAEQLPAAVTDFEAPLDPGTTVDGPGGAESAENADGPDEEPPAPADRVKGVRIYRPAVVGTVLYGPEVGCDVEFWDSAAPSRGAIASIDETPFGWWVPSLAATATATVAGRDYPLVDAFATPLPDQVDFPVDAVVTWVDDGDPAWQRRRAAAREALTGVPAKGPAGDADQRFRNRDELRYCLRSIASYAPWIRRIFLVTDDQVPDWLDTGRPGLTVVPHRDLFAGSGAGPVFNSHAIETRLHLIPDLAEHFLYFNDDMFLGRALVPEDFFLGNGLPRYFPDDRVIPPGEAGPEDSVYVSAQKNTRAALATAVGRSYPRTLKHAPYPLRRSVLTESAERFAEELAGTVHSPFRAAADLAPITLATHFAHATARAVEGRLYDGFFLTDSAEDLARLPELHELRWADLFCLADGVRDGLPAEEQEREVTGFLRAYFPAPSPYEKA